MNMRGRIICDWGYSDCFSYSIIVSSYLWI